MNQSVSSFRSWASQQFSTSTLPDKRLRARLVRYGALQAADPQASTSRACLGEKSERLGAYRMLENPRVKALDILSGPFNETKRRTEDSPRILLIQDSTAVKTSHPSLLELTKGRGLGAANGFCAHHALAVDGLTGEPLGIVDQLIWLGGRDKTSIKKVLGEDTESAKWIKSWKNCRERIEPNFITVADREADQWNFLTLLKSQNQRFVIRCRWDRKVDDSAVRLLKTIRSAPSFGKRAIVIEQRGGQNNNQMQASRTGRKRQIVKCNVQAISGVVLPPIRNGGESRPLPVNVVRVSYQPSTRSKASPLEWILLTSEPIEKVSEVSQIIKDYESRWLIEEFHKCWKSGCRIEKRPFQSIAAMENMMAITATLAVKLLQIRSIAHGHQANRPCSQFLSTEEWHCLWDATEEKSKPKKAPTSKWAALALAKLGAWYDTKGTGKIGWDTIWHGWMQLASRIGGYRLAKRSYGVFEEM